MASWLKVPVKKTESVDFKKPLQKYIKHTFSDETAEEYSDAIDELNKLRSMTVMNEPEKHESALENLYRYYDQVVELEQKLPIADNQIRLNFSWYDVFVKGSILTTRKCSLCFGAYEKICVLFNIGALCSQIAALQRSQTDEELKTAAKYFQLSSGCFSTLKEMVYPELHQIPTPDLSIECLAALSAIMLAQGQEAIWCKASQDKMKPAILAKIAAQASDLYSEASRMANNSTVRSLVDKEWLQIVNGKQHFFLGLAQYYQAQIAKEKTAYGECVARLQVAEKEMTDAVKAGGSAFDGKGFPEKVKREYQEVKKDNDFIYHDRIPKLDTLQAIGRASLAKVVNLSKPASSDFKDLFAGLVPIPVHNAVQSYEARKGEIINREVGRLREGTQLINTALASLNLPASIEDLSGEKVPKSVLEKAAAVTQAGGLVFIDKMMQDLPELLERNRAIMDDAVTSLDEEERSDTQLRERFKEKWTPRASAELTTQLRQEANKYRTIIENAIRADGVVKSKYNDNRAAMELLCKSEGELAGALPSATGSSALSSSPEVKMLRKLLDDIDTLKAEREAIESDFKTSSDDMATKFLSALAADGTIPSFEEITSSNLENSYHALIQQAQENMDRQSQLLAQIQGANDKFLAAKQAGQSSSQREDLLKDLAKAFDVFMELKDNLLEGSKFYNDLTKILVQFQSKVNDWVFARRTEREELSRDLQKSIAQQPSGTTPEAPTHHQAPKQPPARPPPPSMARPHTAPPAQAPQQPYQAMPMPGQYAPYSYAPPGGMYAPYPYSGYYPPQPYPGYMPGQQPPYPQQPPPGGYQPPPGGYYQQR